VKTLRHALIVFLMLSFAAIAPVSADTQKTIFYNLTTDEAWAAGMALGQADKALEAGYKAIIFLNVRGIFIASKSFATDTNGGTGKSLRDMLKSAMEKGAQAILCPMCMAKAGMEMEDVIEGVVKGRPDAILKAMTADDTVIISY
jgi:predicted peroxiredoxin